MSFSRSLCCVLSLAVLLVPACAKKSEPPVAATSSEQQAAAPSEACNGAVFQGQCVVMGNTVTFGNYHQATETPEPMEWIVLDIVPKAADADGRILLLSKYVLAAMPYHNEDEEITWEACSLRSWLNDDFLNTAFDSSEKSQIIATHIETPENPFTNESSGNATDDHIFLLSLEDALDKTDEVEGSGRYFSSDAERIAMATKYATSNDVWVTPDGDTNNTCPNIQCSSLWWLRTLGATDGATFVSNTGEVYRSGLVVNMVDMGVRPAMWVKY